MIPVGLELFDELLTPSARVAVGFDYAASEENWDSAPWRKPQSRAPFVKRRFR